MKVEVLLLYIDPLLVSPLPGIGPADFPFFLLLGFWAPFPLLSRI